MITLRKQFVAVLGALALVAVIAAINPSTGRGQGPGGGTQPTQNVNVVNTASNPVPVVQLGAATVNVANTPTVSVGNLSANPIPVNDVSGSSRQYVQAFGQCTTQARSSCSATVYIVPAGKLLVIEEVAFRIFTGDAGRVASPTLGATVPAGGQLISHPFPATAPTVSYPESGGGAWAVLREKVRIIAGEGFVLMGANLTGNFGIFSLVLYGHLIDAPQQ